MYDVAYGTEYFFACVFVPISMQVSHEKKENILIHPLKMWVHHNYVSLKRAFRQRATRFVEKRREENKTHLFPLRRRRFVAYTVPS